MLHAKFHQTQPSGSRKEDFLSVYHIWAWQLSWSCDQHYVNEFSLILQAYIQNLVENGSVVSEKDKFNFHM